MREKSYSAEYYQRNKERIKARVAAYRKANPEKAREAVRKWFRDPANYERRREYWRKYNHAEPSVLARQRYADKPSIVLRRSEYGKKWRATNPHKNCAKACARRAAKDCRSPKWLTADDAWIIAEIYDLAVLRTRVTGVRHVVDHIVPLKGRTVSGLHVPTNLQVVTADLNARKGNKYPFSAGEPSSRAM